MEKSALVRLKLILLHLFNGFDARLGFIFLALAPISFIVFLYFGSTFFKGCFGSTFSQKVV